MMGSTRRSKKNETGPAHCSKPLEFQKVVRSAWATYQLDAATCSGCKSRVERKPGAECLYVFQPGGFVCSDTGVDIMLVTVGHQIRDGLFPFSGSGAGPEIEQVPYCPRHEKKPSEYGADIVPEVRVRDHILVPDTTYD